MIISLSGFMGSGKSTVGRILAELLDCVAVDLDDEIERREGCRIPEIFASVGESRFREIEAEVLDGIIKARIGVTGWSAVIALGGGTAVSPLCAKALRQTFCIYLRTSNDTLAERLASGTSCRPKLSGNQNIGERIAELMNVRGPLYEKHADLIVDTDGKTPQEVANEIVMMLK